MTSAIVSIKNFKIRKWVSEYIEIRDSKGPRYALTYVRHNVPPEDQESFGEYVRAYNEENLKKINKELQEAEEEINDE